MNYVIKLGERFLIETRNKPQGNEIAQVEHIDIDYYDIELIEDHEYEVIGYENPVYNEEEEMISHDGPIYGETIINTNSYYQVTFSQDKYDAKQAAIAAQASINELRQEEQELLNYLQSTDWMLVRKYESDVAVPQEVLDARAAARTRISEIRDLL